MDTHKTKKETKLYRAANVSRGEALDALMKHLAQAMPGASLVKMPKVGNQYIATIRLADDFESEDDGSDDGGGDEAPFPPKKKKEKSEGSDDGGESDGGDDGGGDEGDGGESPFGGGDEGGLGEHGHPKASLEEVVSLLHQVLQAVHGGGGLHDPLDAAGGPPGLDGPPAPPVPGGPAGHGGAPLPPPVPHKPQMPGGAFAHVASLNRKVAGRRSFATLRADAHEVSDERAVAEAREIFPGYTVKKVVRAGTVEVEGQVVDLAKNNLLAMAFVAE